MTLIQKIGKYTYRNNRSHSSNAWLLAVGLFLFSLFLWWPSLYTPWWGDDYGVLQTAKAARIRDEPWWQVFLPESHWGFWRPLSIDTYWRFVEETLHANSVLAHAANFALWFIASLSVGLCACQLAKRVNYNSPWLLAAITTSIYGLSSIHFLSLHWVSAANSSFIVIFTALSIACWIAAPACNKYTRILLCCCIPLLQLLALFSKESSILIPFLLLMFSLYVFDYSKPGKYELFALAGSVIICCIWYLCLKMFTESRDQAYDLVFEVNIIRNVFSLGAWFLNIPREALRMIATDAKFIGCIWAAASAAPMLGFFYFTVQQLLNVLSRHQIAAAILFVLIAYFPYFLLSSQSYEYYAAIAFIFPSILLSQGLLLTQRPMLVAGLFCISSYVAVQGSREVGYPGLIGRAHWAEQQFAYLKTQDLTVPLIVRVENKHQFYAIGIAGLSWRLGIEEKDILLLDTCLQNSEKWLVQKQDGNFRWENCPPLN